MATARYPYPARRIESSQEFSIVLGGPLYQFLCRAHLSTDTLELVRRRIFSVVGLTWLPLLIMSTLEGHGLRGTSSVPFLFDIAAHVRLLVVLPLLIVAEPIVHRRMRDVVRQFLERRLIPETGRSRFDTAFQSMMRLRNSVTAEMLLIVVVYAVGVSVIWRHFIALSDATTWYATPTGTDRRLSLTGIWYAYVSVPIFQFLLVRWYYRIFIWVRFLSQVSRIRLSLVPTHPDRVCGLGFLTDAAYGFTPIAVAHGAMLVGPVADRIVFVGAQLPDFIPQILALVVFVVGIVFGPFLVFAPQLTPAKRMGLEEYGTLAERYVRQFDAKWLRGGAGPNERLMGSGDIQSLADLANSFEVVKTMRIAPITREGVLGIAAATAAPMAPLALSMVSLQELLRKLFALLF